MSAFDEVMAEQWSKMEGFTIDGDADGGMLRGAIAVLGKKLLSMALRKAVARIPGTPCAECGVCTSIGQFGVASLSGHDPSCEWGAILAEARKLGWEPKP